MENIIINNNISKNNEYDNYDYDIEIDDCAPRSQQPPQIKLAMKPHQLAGLHKALKMENEGNIKYNIKNLNDFLR